MQAWVAVFVVYSSVSGHPTAFDASNHFTSEAACNNFWTNVNTFLQSQGTYTTGGCTMLFDYLPASSGEPKFGAIAPRGQPGK